MKLCLVCSSGGHLAELLTLNEVYDKYPSFIVTYDEKFIEQKIPKDTIQKRYLIKNYINDKVESNYVTKLFFLIYHMLNVAYREFIIFAREKPDVVFSTGSEIALPIILYSKIFRKKTIFLESLCRVQSLSGTGKIIYPVANVFLVQWKDLLTHNKAKYYGNILDFSQKNEKTERGDYIFATVGTAPFTRLATNLDEISSKLDKKIILQKGRTNYKPKNIEYFDFLENEPEYIKLVTKAKLVISHAGVGSIITILNNNQNLILVPRYKKYGEHNDDHQMEICKILNTYGISVAYDSNDLYTIIKEKYNNDMRNDYINKLSNKPALVNYLSNYLEKIDNEKASP